jgi:hypothetical protein
VISTCEVATNPETKNLLGPDVQLFDSTQTEDANGFAVLHIGNTYQPSAANLARDSGSIGLAFTAVKAAF